jgi:hypothetical protein
MARSSAWVRVLGYRGVLGYWGIGLLGYWAIGLLGYWAIGLLGYWAIGLLGYWAIGLLELELECWSTSNRPLVYTLAHEHSSERARPA